MPSLPFDLVKLANAPDIAALKHKADPKHVVLIEAAMTAIAPVLNDLRDEVVKLKDEIVLLKRGLDHTMQYEDTWQQHRTYTRGAVVTFDGGMWLARETTNSRPKTDDTWHLCVKSGMAPKK